MMTTLVQLLQAANLTLTGIGVLLLWLGGQRLLHIGHIRMAAKGWVSTPRHLLGPLHRSGDWWKALAAFCGGLASIIVFADTAVAALHLPAWLSPRHYDPAAELVRIACAFVVLLYLLASVSENPRYKLIWAACWAVFSFAVVSLA